MDERTREINHEERNEVLRRVQEAKNSIAALHAENDMFDTFIGRFCPQNQENLPLQDNVETSHQETKSARLSGDLQQLTLNQKLYVSQKAVEAASQSLKELKQRHETLQTNFKVFSREAEMRLARIKKERSDFERRIHPKTMNELSAMETKKVLQSILGNTKTSQLVKFVGYNQVLKDKKRKLLMQLQRPDKEDHFQDQREENVDRNSDELQIKYSKIQHNLSSHKDKLQSVLHQSAELSREITKKEKLLRKVEDDLKWAEERRLKQEDLVKLLSSQVNDSLALDVTHYTLVKEKKKSLLSSIRAWERKVRVAEQTRNEPTYTETAALNSEG